MSNQVSPIDSCPCCGAAIENVSDTLVDADMRLTIRNGYMAEMSNARFQIFHKLYQNRGRVVLREQLHDTLYWEKSSDEDPDMKIIDVQISHLRKLLKPLGIAIETQWGRGYRLVEQEVREDA
jgi:DNA-binding response OmpR family regulator